MGVVEAADGRRGHTVSVVLWNNIIIRNKDEYRQSERGREPGEDIQSVSSSGIISSLGTRKNIVNQSGRGEGLRGTRIFQGGGRTGHNDPVAGHESTPGFLLHVKEKYVYYVCQ